MSLIKFLLGRRLANTEAEAKRMGIGPALPAMGLDGLSSAAYGPEATLSVLIAAGAAGVAYVVPISAAIVLLLFVLYFSYRQTIAAYPQNGGSYTVASDNLGTYPGLLAATALMIDYTLNVAVGISAGVGALISAIPPLQPYILPLCLGILALITVINLRGTRESGVAFALPTYLLIVTLSLVILLGLFEVVKSGGHPHPVIPPPALPKAVSPL